MPLVLTNTTDTPIELFQIGVTVPASDSYDLSYRSSEALAASTELADHIANGTLVVTEDTLNALANATGFTRVISGPTVDRPTAPPEGTLRHNLDTNVTETFMAGNWQNMPRLLDIDFRVDPETSILYRKAANGKFLSVSTFAITFSHTNCQDQTWLNVDSNVILAYAGYGISFDGTITYLGLYGDDPYTSTKHISLYINSVETPDVIVLAGGESSINRPANYDFGPQDTIRFRFVKDPSGGSKEKYGGIRVTAFFSLRNIAMEAS